MNIQEPIRILHVLGSTNLGGAQSFVMNLYRKIDKDRIQFDFVIHTEENCHYDEEIKSYGGKVFSCPPYNFKNHFKYIKWWRNFYKHNYKNYAYIHSHIRSTALIIILCSKEYNIKTIVHSHSISSGKGITSVIKNIMQYPVRYISDYQFACSKLAGEWLFGKKINEKKSYYIIKNAIDIDRFIYNNQIREKIRKELGINNHEIVVGHIGRMTIAKNHDRIIRIFNEVVKEDANFRLLLVGDGELRESINELIKEFKLEKKVFMSGAKENPEEYLQAMDLFLFPSLWEGLGISLIEAQANGLNCFISENIPDEVKLTHLVDTLSLNSSDVEWSNQILKTQFTRTNYNDLNIKNQISSQGYNINVTTKFMEEFYTKEKN